MHIKTITIQGFKSYRDQVAIEPFHPRHNVIVGRNGSGKSNFFSAIRFVLSDETSSLNRDERQRLLHEGSSTSTTLSAYVEIVFDNADGRFPTSLPEVRLRRTIGLKKDEYSLDKKSTTKAEVQNLLESAGFSKSNPYYIVPQGRVTFLTNVSDKERLTVLKRVAGTEVYETKRAESEKIMQETEAKRDTIQGLLTYIEERLNELEQEKQELKEYQQKDRERRCLEYALHSREQEEVSTKLDQAENDHRQEQHNSNTHQDNFNKREEVVQAYEASLTTAKHALSTTSIALRQYENEMADLVRTRTEIECVIADYKADAPVDMAGAVDALEQRIADATERLEALSDDLDQRIAEEREARETLDDTQSKLQVLYAKQGRVKQFKTKAERDLYLAGEIKSLKAYETAQQARVDELETSVGAARRGVEDVVARGAAEAAEDEERREGLRTMGEQVSGLRKSMEEMSEERKNLWREDGKLGQTVANAKSEMDNAERGLAGMMDKDTSNGLRAVKHIAKRLKLDGVCGPLYDLFEVPDRYKQAVEVTAGTSLFHVVVDNDDTASKLLEVMNKDRSGRVTFMPLNRLRSVNVNYPKANDAIPMISKLKFDRAYVMAFEQVFGRTIICEDLPTAAQYTRTHGLNAVTVEGDRADRKGALTGGYHDVRKSRLDQIKALRRWRDEYERDAERHAEVKDAIARLEQRITHASGQISAIDAKRRRVVDVRRGEWTKKEEASLRDRLERLEGQLGDAEAELRSAGVKRAAYEDEVKSPLRQALSDDEQKSLDKLTREAEDQKTELRDRTSARQKAASERGRLYIELTENLQRKRRELLERMDDDVAMTADEVEVKRVELKSLVRDVEALQEQIEESEKEVEKLSNEIADVKKKLEDEQNEQMDAARAMLRLTKTNERYLAKKQTLASRREECENAIRDLGVLPEEAYSKYTDMAADKIMKRLHKTSAALKKYAHVNKKAFDQYQSFTTQRDEHLARRDELDASADSIKELIETLDQRKDEAIERTFKQVSKHFEEVFETLVPAGKGVLVMQKKVAGYIDEESEEPTAKGKGEIDNYTGVSIRVSFNSKADEGQRIQQLSGGQKSLVALATVFAIQKCDPAPFYLFDEIDANLDAQYRTQVASMIHDLSTSAQFITTTFRSEMLTHADKFYGVYFDRQKVSTIATITKDEAAEFVENAAGGR